ERAFALPVEILRGDADVGVTRRLSDRMHRRERRPDDDLDVADVLDCAAQFLHEDDRFLHGLEHLPVAGDEWNAHRSVGLAGLAGQAGLAGRNATIIRPAWPARPA